MKTKHLLAFSLLLSAFIFPLSAFSQGTAFTYQGRLNDANGPATGIYDLRFGIYDAASGGTQVGSTLTHSATAVSNGLFTVTLDFGNQFNGADRWVEIGVRTNGGGALTALAPRQPLTPAPYAIYSANAGSASSVSAANISGTIALTQLPGTILTNNATGVTLNGNFTGNGGGLTNVSALPTQIVRNFVVSAGASVTAGDVVSFLNGTVQKGLVEGTNLSYGAEGQFRSAGTRGISAAALSPTRLVIAFKGDDFINRAVIGDISDTTITFGTAVPAASSGSSFDNLPFAVAALSSNKFIVAYQDVGNSDRGTARIGDISGNSITFGSNVVFNPAATYDGSMSVAALGTNKFIVAFQDGSPNYNGTTMVGDVTTNFITFGAKQVFGAYCFAPICVPLGSSTFAVAYQDAVGGRAIAGTVSGTSISYGAAALFGTNDINSSYNTSAAALNAGQFVVCYQSVTNSVYRGVAVIGSLSGTAISFGPTAAFNSGSPSYLSPSAFTATRFALIYSDGGNGGRGTAIIGSVSGSNIVFGAKSVFSAANTWFMSAVTPTSDTLVAAYLNLGSPFYGNYRVGHAPPDLGTFLGIAQSAAGAGQTVPVVIGGVSSSHTGLISGTTYYSDGGGNLVTGWTAFKVGLAISPTELLLNSGFGL